jgi:hypothetical protein
MLMGRLKDFARRHWQKLGLGLGGLGVVFAVLWWQLGEPHYLRMLREAPLSGRCERKLDRATLKQSLSLMTRFLVKHQKPAGNFDYEYDHATKTYSADDSDVRQAGALWGISLLHRYQPSPELQAAIEKGQAFFEQNSRRAKGGRRCIAYPGEPNGGTGTVALVALSYIELLRSGPPGASEETKARLHKRLKEYLKQLVFAQREDGVWHSFIDERCNVSGEPNPYADGEALLALAKARKYLGITEFDRHLLKAASGGRKRNIDDALKEHPDSDTTKGFYQWSSMAFYELVTSDLPDMQTYGDTLLRLADWMIDEHDTLWRTRNTGYAYEGIIHAYALAKQRGDQARVAKYGCVIDVGLNRLLAWQVGGPLGNSFVNRAKDDPAALGGVQNSVREAPLRIDVSQHQSHATLLALEHVYTTH